MTTSAEIRTTLVDALNIDLVGPTPHDTDHAEEILRQAPSKWYLTGFLAPFGAPPDLRSDDDADDDLPEEITTSDPLAPEEDYPEEEQGKSKRKKKPEH
jgi:hypothetical protein